MLMWAQHMLQNTESSSSRRPSKRRASYLGSVTKDRISECYFFSQFYLLKIFSCNCPGRIQRWVLHCSGIWRSVIYQNNVILNHDAATTSKVARRKDFIPQFVQLFISWPIPVAARSKAWVYWDCGFESRRVHGCLSLGSVVCSQVEVSAMGWSLVQRSPTECCVSECVIAKPRTMIGLGPLGAVEP